MLESLEIGLTVERLVETLRVVEPLLGRLGMVLNSSKRPSVLDVTICLGMWLVASVARVDA